MKTRAWTGLLLLELLVGCRTQLKPVTKAEPKTVSVGEKSCNVFDYPNATDVPEGAKNLGWVTVKKGESDDETFVKLREKICEMGGDALSQPAWEHEAGEYEPSTLKANAWALP